MMRKSHAATSEPVAHLGPDLQQVPSLEQAAGPVAAHGGVLEIRTRGERTLSREDDHLGREIVGEVLRGLRELKHELPA